MKVWLRNMEDETKSYNRVLKGILKKKKTENEGESKPKQIMAKIIQTR